MEKQSVQFLRLFGKVLAATAIIALIILLLGYFLQWNEPVRYSNAFFLAGAIVIVLGVLSITGGFAQRANFQMTYAESAGNANIAERNQRTAADITQRYGSMILLMITGILLIVIAVVIGEAVP
jgi:uncharacterized membrane protein